MSIKTIIFDLGGVYFTRGTYLAIMKFMDLFDIDNFFTLYELFGDNYKKEGYLLRKGIINTKEFTQRVGDKLNLSQEQKRHIIPIWFDSYVPQHKIEALIRDLHQKYRMIVFSGNIKERVEFLNNRYHFLDYFDDAVFSYSYEKNKNDIEFYEELINHIECRPEEALLVEDESKNVKIAESIGLNAIQYYYTDFLIEKLNRYDIELNIH